VSIVKAAFAILIALSSLVALGAEYTLPTALQPVAGSRTPNVNYGVGIPGGIPAGGTVRSVVDYGADPTGVASSSSAITAAIAASGDGDVVFFPAGTYSTGTITIPASGGSNKTNIILRGAVDPATGFPASTISNTGGNGINFGSDPVFNGLYSANTTITKASMTKGATVLTVASSADFVAGNIVRITVQNDPNIPILVPNGNNEARFANYLVASVPDGTHIEITPKLHEDFTTVPGTPKIEQTQQVFFYKVQTVGIENLIIDGAAAGGGMARGINVEGSGKNCWVYNVHVLNHGNFGMAFNDMVYLEVAKCWVKAPYGGPSSNKAGYLVHTVTNGYFYDNIVEDNGPGFEINYGTTGTVFAYNFALDAADSKDIITNHGAYNSWNHYEGNLAGTLQADGYHSGVANDTIYRNWFTAINNGSPTFIISLKRGTRNYALVGNVWLNSGYAGGGNVYSDFGTPNISNSSFDGTASFGGALSTLTTRTSATAGTITAPSGHGVTTGATIDVWWVSGSSVFIRRNVTVGTVSGTSIPFSGGDGTDLPSAASEIYVPTSNTAVIDYPYNWNSTTQLVKSWTAVLTERTDDQTGEITLDAGQITDFSGHLDRSFGRRFGINGTNMPNQVIGGTPTGDVVPISFANDDLPALSSAISLNPSPLGFQEMDTDVVRTTLFKANYSYTSDSIPSVESIGSDTLADSWYLSAKPSWFGSMTWPPFDPFNPPTAPNTTSVMYIPAQYRYYNGNESYLGGGAPSYTASRLKFLRR
jgi:hypothetical protein